MIPHPTLDIELDDLPDWPSPPGTAPDDGIPAAAWHASYSAGWLARARQFNPTFDVGVATKKRRGRKKGSVQVRRTREENGVTLYRCSRHQCGAFKPCSEFYAKRDHPNRIQGICRACTKIVTAERHRARMAARRAEREATGVCEAAV